jgi:beta-galactosidase
MKTRLIFFLLMCCTQLGAQPVKNGLNLFDEGWKFHRGGAQGAENPSFDDSGWRNVDLPHDWSIEDLPGTESPFDQKAISQASGGFTTGGTGWYRKHFFIAGEYPEKQINICFEGIYMNSKIWLNGRETGQHPYGYTSFWLDLTDAIRSGKENILAVKVVNEGENSRWYSGSGIYRHVWLRVTDPVHITNWGTSITTPEISSEAAKVMVITKVMNTNKETVNARLVTSIFNASGTPIETGELKLTLNSGGSEEFSQEFTVRNPVLWSPDSPVLYKAVSGLYQGDKKVDKTETSFGFRTISFSVDKGFLLNGQSLKLKGGCVHHDNGPLGARAYDRAEERRVELLKASGFNAIRCAHNPPSPAFLDACDRLGMLVIDEAFDMWEKMKNPYDYHLWFKEWWQQDIESMVLRDRNHPSVILWSIGNEIPERGSARGAEWSATLAAYVRKLDPTRGVSAAVNGLNPDKDPYFATLDVAGYNYPIGEVNNKTSYYKVDHERIPGRIIYCSESFPLEAFGSWAGAMEYPWVLGDFVWTAFDYIGEASIGWRGYWQENSFFPWNLAFCGDIDICGWKRPQSFYRDALWKQNQISIFVKPPVPSFELNPNRMDWSKWHWHDAVADWNWEGYEGASLKVSVYSSCPETELFLNGKSLGRKKTGSAEEYKADWNVSWQKGILKAVGWNARKQVASAELMSAGQPAHIRLTADRQKIQADGQDLSYITVEITDEKGIRNPKSENPVHFNIEGPGEILAVANANPVSLESYLLPRRKAWQGRCLVIVKSAKEPGTIRLEASSPGISTSRLDIVSR